LLAIGEAPRCERHLHRLEVVGEICGMLMLIEHVYGRTTSVRAVGSSGTFETATAGRREPPARQLLDERRRLYRRSG
jgi:hypothetical protein